MHIVYRLHAKSYRNINFRSYRPSLLDTIQLCHYCCALERLVTCLFTGSTVSTAALTEEKETDPEFGNREQQQGSSFFSPKRDDTNGTNKYHHID